MVLQGLVRVQDCSQCWVAQEKQQQQERCSVWQDLQKQDLLKRPQELQAQKQDLHLLQGYLAWGHGGQDVGQSRRRGCRWRGARAR